MRPAVVMTLLMLVSSLASGVAHADIIYYNSFESEASLDGVQIIGTTDYGIQPGSAPCPRYLVGDNLLWMYGEGNTYCTVYVPGPNWTNYCVGAWCKVNSNVSPYFNVFFRIQDVGGPWYGIENGYCVHCRHSQNEIELQRVVNGAGTPIVKAYYDFVPGTWYALKVEAGNVMGDPTPIKVYVNTGCDDDGYQLLINTADATYTSGGVAVGSLSSGGGGAVHESWFDWLQVTTLDHSGGPSATEATTWGGIKSLYR